MKNQKNLFVLNWPKQKESNNFIAFENYSDNNKIKIKHQEKIAHSTQHMYTFSIYILRVNTADWHGMEEAQDIIILIST